MYEVRLALRIKVALTVWLVDRAAVNNAKPVVLTTKTPGLRRRLLSPSHGREDYSKVVM